MKLSRDALSRLGIEVGHLKLKSNEATHFEAKELSGLRLAKLCAS